MVGHSVPLARRLLTGNIGGMNQVQKLWNTTSAIPVIGKRVFSIVFSQKAPYFATIRPRFTVVEPNRAELVIRKRRRVHNHIGTVHAIAVCNGLEAAMGLLAEATTPPGRRWIPKGMEVAYLAKSTTDLVCVAQTDPQDWTDVGDVPVRVRAVRTDGTVVVAGVITIYVSEKKPVAP